MEAIESLAGMVSSMLDFPLVGFLWRLVPAGGSGAGQQVATAFGAGLDNLGTLCSQVGLDRWELLGLAVLSAITVYRKELSSNSVYNGKGAGGDSDGCGGRRHHRTDGGGHAVVLHVDGCHVAVAAAAAAASAGEAEQGSDGYGPIAAAAAAAAAAGKPCMCARIAALQRQRAAAARRLRATEDERRLQRFVSGRIQSMNLPVNHLQQLRASMDASWSSFSTAWEARRTRGSGSGISDDEARESGREQRAKTVSLPVFKMPPCSHHPSAEPPPPSDDGGVQRRQRGERGRVGGGHKEEGAPPVGGAVAGGAEECVECAAIAAAHLAAASLLRGSIGGGADGDGALGDGRDGLLLPKGEEAVCDDLWAGSSLGVLPADALHRAVTFLTPQDLLELAKVSNGAREAADSQLVWREVWWARFGAVWESDICRKAARRWHLHDWNPKSSAVTQGWKEFFFEFEASWLEWLAAGQNFESSCLVGVHGRLYDITDFMHQHPGSPETLMDNAGADASEMFEDVGHSLNARDLMKSLRSLAPGPTGRDSSSSSPSSSSSFSSRLTSYARAGGGGLAGGSSFDPRVGACLLSSTAQRLREGRALAKREAKAVHLAAATGAAVGATRLGVQEFVCEECERAFEPTDLDGDGEAGKLRRSRCKAHCDGKLHVFYSPVRREWGGFYSCCRQHVCFSLPEGY
eukprot:g13950.t1